MTFLLRIELVHDRQSKRAAQQIGQAIGTEYPISPVNRLGFMVHLLRGDGLYPFLEELAGLKPKGVALASDGGGKVAHAVGGIAVVACLTKPALAVLEPSTTIRLLR
ncbi:hypothetical protein XI01_03260 [Bradyrhizobium sp. CCBAU 21360]|nr:hypothetical protein [Bradyrhizobium sp. CCBAU 21360]